VSVFLDAAALRTLTGFAQKRRQVEQLRKMGVPFHVNRRGEPIVACSSVEGGRAPEKKAAAWKPAALSRG
jgi:hypothetical protein